MNFETEGLWLTLIVLVETVFGWKRETMFSQTYRFNTNILKSSVDTWQNIYLPHRSVSYYLTLQLLVALHVKLCGSHSVEVNLN